MPVLTDNFHSWAESAACRSVNPDLWHPEKGHDGNRAKKVCAGCEVRAECLDTALANGERQGVWGGLSERQRRPLLAVYRRDQGQGAA